MEGIINVDKPRGWTSHDIVARVRRLMREKRVGHAGTLDPMATGVLLVCVGRATRLSEYLMASQKTYRAVLRLGVETDTYDAEGQVVAQHDVEIDEAGLRAALARFEGEIEQIPPMYSALKRDGKPLYKLARRGIEVEREPRRVTIYDMTLREWHPASAEATIDVRCSPGTYIRSLAHDVGVALGCGAHLTGLTRLASGRFTLDDAVKLETLEAAVAEGTWAGYLHPLDAALQDLPAIQLDTDETRRLLMGQAIPAHEPAPLPGSPYRAYEAGGSLVALVAYDPSAGLWRPFKVLAGDAEHIK